ncbi:MAG: T9SS type A sorting domain-containing protein, partial [Bacteroidota bacterium]
MKRIQAISILLAALSSSLVAQSFQKPPAQQPRLLHKSAQTKNAAILNINNFTYWLQANGQGAQPPNQAYNGAVFPRGTTNVIFGDGFIWGGKCYLDAARTQPAPVQVLRIGGNTYNVGNAVGWINGTGANAVAVSTSDSKARIYRIRRDYASMSADEIRLDASENNLTSVISVIDADAATVQAQYATDWSQWPAGPTNDPTVPNLGAPYIDRNGIPGYQKPPQFSSLFTIDSLISGTYDEPGVAGSDPASPADQVVWTVFNDLTRGNMIGFLGSEPMGIEGQLTVWGYKGGDALGNIFYKRIKLINKGGAVVNSTTGAKGGLYLDSMYIAQWSDEDVGYYGDDVVGCDSIRGLTFFYNGKDVDNEFAKFNLPPPAAAYDFLAGALVSGQPGDSAMFDLKRMYGKRNLSMTSFTWMAPTNIGPPPDPFYDLLTPYWKMMRGFLPGNSGTSDRLYPVPPGDSPTKFTFGGDPVARTGSLDGLGTSYSPQPGDRRTLSGSGPFLFAPGDTEELYVAVVAGLGADRISSVAVMKSTDALAQAIFDLGFQVPRSPADPVIAATELNGSVILSWDNPDNVPRTEQDVSRPGNYRFEGYNVYQLSSPDLNSAAKIRIATFDRVNGVRTIIGTRFDSDAKTFLPFVLENGTDSGVRRSIHVTKDALSGGTALRNGKEYYFAVTAYNYSSESGNPSFETRLAPLRVSPHIPFGIAGLASYGDTSVVYHPQGSGTGRVTTTVTNPLASNGCAYEVRFDSSGGPTTWSLYNITQSRTVISNQPLYVGSDDPPAVEGGVHLLVAGPNSPGDVYSYSLSLIQTGTEVQKASARRVNVFPNPYYADQVQRGTTSRAVVTFSNLPQRATIRIFNLAGHLVRRLHKDNTSQYFDWDLTNEDNWQVGSGMYLCY